MQEPIKEEIIIEEPVADAIREENENAKRSKTHIGKAMWALFGIIAFVLGTIGAFLPVLPTTPFILLAAFCFARSSERLDTWFKSTKLYHKVLEGYVTKRQMTMYAKLSILIPVSILFGISMFFMWHIVAMRYVMGIIWAAHIIYFGFMVPTVEE